MHGSESLQDLPGDRHRDTGIRWIGAREEKELSLGVLEAEQMEDFVDSGEVEVVATFLIVEIVGTDIARMPLKGDKCFIRLREGEGMDTWTSYRNQRCAPEELVRADPAMQVVDA